MTTGCHDAADGCEFFEVSVLTRQERVPLEVGNDALEEMLESPCLPLQGLVASVRPDASASEPPLNEAEDLGLIAVLADREAGLTSQPTTSLARGEIETVKQPSPSTYPEMYAERNSRLRLGPASDRIHRLSPALRTASLRSHVQKGRSVVTGSDTKVCRLPTGLPSRCHDALIVAYEEGFPVISRLSAGITSGSGNPVTRQGISLP
jgi:hypothetical protein